jgi:hypothetical protein
MFIIGQIQSINKMGWRNKTFLTRVVDMFWDDFLFRKFEKTLYCGPGQNQDFLCECLNPPYTF